MQLHRKLSTKLLLTFVCLLTMLLAGCGKSAGVNGFAINAPTPPVNGTPRAPYDQQIYHAAIVGSDLDIATFDPALTVDANSYAAVNNVFNGLVRFDDNLQVQPELAESWTQSSDGLHWTFHLRPGLTFSDGTPLTSKDVAYSLDRALQPATKSTISLSYLALIKDSDKLNAGRIKTMIGDSILTPDDTTVTLVTAKKAAYFLYTLTYPTSYVVEKKLIDKYGPKFTDHLTEGGGAGPFMVSQYLHKQEIDFVPNPYYYGFKPLLQKLVYSFLASSDIAYREYQNGQLDVTSVPSDRLTEAMQLTTEFYKTPTLFTSHLAMNFLAKPFDNLHIRQAFALAINREALNHTIYGDTLIPTYHIVPLGMVGYNPDLTGPANIKNSRGDVNAAKHLLQVGLQEEGWSDVSHMPPIKFTYSKDPTSDKLVAAIIQMWQSVLGVNVLPDAIDFNTLLNELTNTIGSSKGVQMWIIGWLADYPDPQDWTTLQFDKGSPNNYMNYGQNNTADALPEQVIQQQLEQADAESNASTRSLLYQTAEQQLINQVAWIPLFQTVRLRLRKTYVQGVVPNALSITPPNDWANIYIGAH